MIFTVYTFILSLIWCNLFILAAALLRRKKNFLYSYGLAPLAALLVASLLRLAVAIELPYTKIIRSYEILPAYLCFIRVKISVGGLVFSRSSALIFIWIIVSFVLVSRIIIRQIALNRKISKLSHVHDPKLIYIANRIIFSSRPKQKFNLIVSTDVDIPMITGLFTPTILFPAISVSDEDLEYIMQHEWNHFLHKDLWIKLLVEVVCAVFWWNPFVYVLRKDLNLILEIHSDLKITSGLDEQGRLKYLTSALNVMKNARLRSVNVLGNSLSLAGDAKGGNLEQRFKMVLASPQKFSKKYASILSAIIVCALFFSYAFVIQGAGPPEDVEDYAYSNESTYLVDNRDGTYTMHTGNNELIISNGIEKEPFSTMPIMEDEK